MKTVYCPVKGAAITGADCMIICDVSEKLLKTSVLPDGIVWNDEQYQKCLRCPYHDDLDVE